LPAAGDGLAKKDTIEAVADLGRGNELGGEAAERRKRLVELYREVKGCTRCPQLVRSRTTVVFGAGNANADVMFVGEAPGATEDEQGLPFVGRAGKLLEELLAGIGLSRKEVFIANVLKCRPPGNRDPLPTEIENCRPYLYKQVELVAPKVVATLGNFATKLLRGSNEGISRLHGRPEVRRVGGRWVRLLPLYHPAAALRSPALIDELRADLGQLPQLVALPEPAQGEGQGEEGVAIGLGEPANEAGPTQLGLF